MAEKIRRKVEEAPSTWTSDTMWENLQMLPAPGYGPAQPSHGHCGHLEYEPVDGGKILSPLSLSTHTHLTVKQINLKKNPS